MFTLRALGMSLASLLMIVSLASPAKAALIYEFGYNAPIPGFEGTGSFELAETPVFGGSSSTTDDFVFFQFSGLCGGLACSFDENSFVGGGARKKKWTVASDGTILDLDLLGIEGETDTEVVFSFHLLVLLSPLGNLLDVTELSSSCTSTRGGMECDGTTANDDFVSRIETLGDGAFLRQVVEVVSVPEPATFSLFTLGLIGLAGMGFMRRRAEMAAA